MGDLDDYDIEKAQRDEVDPELTWERPGLGATWWIAAAGIVALAIAGYFGYRWYRVTPPPAQKTAESTPVPAPTLAATPAPSPLDLPPLGASDALVRELAGGLSADPLVALWVRGEDLVRRFTAGVANVVRGESIVQQLPAMPFKGSFMVVNRGGQLTIDPRSYARYDAIANAFASLDAAACARVYRQLQPLFHAGYRELGESSGFDEAFQQSLERLISTPIPTGAVPVREVVRATVLYEYADPRLEALSPAQKYLIRMGPQNARRVQAKLGEILRTLGGAPAAEP
jgi:hypothetical protein